jgi:hypothetical protein
VQTTAEGGVTAKAGKAELTSITAMTNATVTNNRMRLIMRYPFPWRAGLVSPAVALHIKCCFRGTFCATRISAQKVG